MGSNPIESSAVKDKEAFTVLMHLEMRVTREGLKVIPDLKMPCKGLHSGRYMGLTEHWKICLSVDGSVRVPKKGVPSCDKLREDAGSL